MMSSKVQSLLSAAFKSSEFSVLQKGLTESNFTKDEELLKSALDVAFRDHLKRHLIGQEKLKHPDLDRCQLLVTFAINAARKGYSNATLPILLLSDLFDVLPLEHCQSLFECVEQNVQVWKEELFFAPVRNHLLRICNDLLRRLSRTQNTVFCGRILVFLAKFFPLTERSGLNVISEFNLDNTTVFGEEADDEVSGVKCPQDGVDIEEDEKNPAIDYSLYRKFWELQDYFRNPTQCYDRLKWKTFEMFSNDVLSIFQSSKLDSISGKRNKPFEGSQVEEMLASGSGKKAEEYFAKYLTNQNLLQLQLSDSSFRRFILVQFLILFQYLESSVKFKNDVEVLSEEQSRWITLASERVSKLMAETPPDGLKFCRSVEHILHREQQWNGWKNEGCPPFMQQEDKKGSTGEKANATGPSFGTARRKRKLGDQIRDAELNKKFLMGNLPLTKLWNVCPDNMQACSAPERDFLPSMDQYFEEAIDQLNPENQVEDAYKKVNNGAWGWRALRLLAKKSPHFFTYGNHPIAKLPDYLEQMLKKMCKDSSLNSSGASAVNAAAANGAAAGSGDASNGNVSALTPTACSSESLRLLADRLDENWSKLFPKLGLTKDQQEEIEKETTINTDRAMLMLEKWVSIEGDGANPDELIYILEGLKMKSFADGIFQQASSSPSEVEIVE